MDFGKFKYDAAVKARESRKNQVNTVIKEMKLRPKIDSHDYETKKGHILRFLNAGDKVKITIMFRGREQSRPELGYRLLQRLAADIGEMAVIESAPLQDGRNMTMVLAPVRKKTAPVKTSKPESESATVAQAPVAVAPAPAAVAEPIVEVVATPEPVAAEPTPVVEPVAETPAETPAEAPQEAPVKKAAVKKAPAKKAAVKADDEAPAKKAAVKKAPAKKAAVKKEES